jgi:hypothetical protein
MMQFLVRVLANKARKGKTKSERIDSCVEYESGLFLAYRLRTFAEMQRLLIDSARHRRESQRVAHAYDKGKLKG